MTKKQNPGYPREPAQAVHTVDKDNINVIF